MSSFSLKKIFLPVALAAATAAFPARAETPEAPPGPVSFAKVFSFIRANKKMPKDVGEILRDYAAGKIQPANPGNGKDRPALGNLPKEYKTRIAEAYKRDAMQDAMEDKDGGVPIDAVALAAFDKIRNTISDYYVIKPDTQALFNDAIEGIALARLEDTYEGNPDSTPADMDLVEAAAKEMAKRDPHSSYSKREKYKETLQEMDGGFAGIGIDFEMKGGRIHILKVTKGAPADMAGIKAGDVVIAVRDGLAEEGGLIKPVNGLTLTQAGELLTGEAGTFVSLTYVRKGRTYEAPMQREFIEQNPVTKRIINLGPGKKIGYLSLSSFTGIAVAKLKEAIEETDKDPKAAPDHWVLDLRNNPGGLLDQGINTADLFLEHGLILATAGRTADDNEIHYADEEYTEESYKGDILKGKKLTVLMNGDSASASEIVAGALKDNRRAKIVGTISYGKGSVQTIYPIEQTGGALRETTALYFTPSGSIQQKGIVPNMLVAAADDGSLDSERDEPGAIAYPGKLDETAPDSEPTSQSCSAPTTGFTLKQAKKIDSGLLRRDDAGRIARFTLKGDYNMKSGRYVMLDETLACAAEDLAGVQKLTRVLPVITEKVPLPPRRPPQ